MRQDKIKKLSDCFVLNNGFRIPCLVFDFEISAEDMMILDSMEHVGESGLHPDESCFLLK